MHSPRILQQQFSAPMNRHRSPVALVVAALATVAFVFAAVAFLFVGTSSAQVTKTFSETYTLDKQGEVVIDTYKGTIEVATWNRDEVSVEVTIEGEAEAVELTEVNIDSRRNRLALETDYEQLQNRGGWFGGNSYEQPFAHYRIMMPRTASLVIDDYKSDTVIEGLSAEVAMETYKGNVDIRGQAGPVALETYKGDVTISYDRYAESVFDTYKGTIQLRIPSDAGFDLAADMGRKGDFDSDFEMMTFQSRWSDDDDDKRYSGRIGGGGPRLAFETYKGSLDLVRI